MKNCKCTQVNYWCIDPVYIERFPVQPPSYLIALMLNVHIYEWYFTVLCPYDLTWPYPNSEMSLMKIMLWDELTSDANKYSSQRCILYLTITETKCLRWLYSIPSWNQLKNKLQTKGIQANFSLGHSTWLGKLQCAQCTTLYIYYNRIDRRFYAIESLSFYLPPVLKIKVPP